MAGPGAWAILVTELVKLIRVHTDPAKRQASYELYLDKMSAKKIKVGADYINTTRQLIYKLDILYAKFGDQINDEDKKSFRRIKKYLNKYYDQWRNF